MVLLLNPHISFVDDIMFYFNNIINKVHFRKILKEFSSISGLLINEDKSFFINVRNSSSKCPERFKYLGINFIAKTGQPDWQMLLSSISKSVKLLSIRFKRNYYYEKACLLNTFIIPKISFYTRSFIPPPWVCTDLNLIFNTFIP